MRRRRSFGVFTRFSGRADRPRAVAPGYRPRSCRCLLGHEDPEGNDGGLVDRRAAAKEAQDNLRDAP